jgi:type IV secretion system protein VirD4
MVSRQETARPLLTPGEVMQLPPDQAIVLVSGLAPVRAFKLRHYEDANFVVRLRSPPQLATDLYLDRPRSRPNDWARQIRAVDVRLATLPYRDLMQSGGEEGGLKQQLPPLFEEAAPHAAAVKFTEERLLDDDADVAADRNQMQRAVSASSAIGSAHAVTRDDDDLLPAF